MFQTKLSFQSQAALPLFFLASLSVLLGCAKSNSLNSTTVLTSGTLASASNPGAFLSSSRLRLTSSGCSGSIGGAPATNCLTPENVSGKIHYIGLMIGSQNGTMLGPLLGTKENSTSDATFKQDELSDFDFSARTALDGTPILDESRFPSDDMAIASRLEIYFGYLDVVFALAESDGVAESLQQVHTVRVVFGDIEGTEMKKGDLLYRSGTTGDFKWCTADGCTSSTRPTSGVLQHADIAAYSGTSDGRGNQHIPTIFVQLNNSVKLTAGELKKNKWAFEADFAMTNGVIFIGTPSEWTTVQQLIANFGLAASIAGGTGGGSGFTAQFTATGTAL